MKLRNFLYNTDIFLQKKLQLPTVSIGNLSMGGTGKTPAVILLTQYLLAKKIRTLVVSRGYGRKYQDYAEVPLQGACSERFGDEPCLIKQKCPEAKVFVGAGRGALATAAMAKYKFDVIVADDAFQHRSLARDLDIVLIDATEPIGNYQVIPCGRLREDLSSLGRADIIIYTKINLVSESSLSEVEALIRPFLSSKSKSFKAQLVNLSDINKSLKYILVSGVGNPKSVEATLSADIKILKHMTYPDHYEYTLKDVNSILYAMKKSGAEKVLTTEKDFVKLKAFADLLPKLVPFEVKMQINSERDFFEIIDSYFI